MKRSTDRILTTHVGSLPRPEELIAAYRKEPPDSATLAEVVRRSVADVVRRQASIGIDVVNDGEFGKPVQDAVDYGAWMKYLAARLTGFTLRERPPRLFPGKDREDFREFYEYQAPLIGELLPFDVVCVDEVRYTGHEAIRRDIDNLRAALSQSEAAEAFMPMASPASLESLQPNEHYKTQDEYAWALAEALRHEYAAVANAGLIVQIDDPGIWVIWDFWFARDNRLREFRKLAEARVEMLNHALSGIPEEQVRYHICWGSWHGPHRSDIPLAEIVDLVLRVRAGAYCVEAANARHETDWKVWRDVKLPDGKILIPGVVSHATNLLETPELIADRVARYARVAGRENVIAGTDCGLGGRVHSQIAWAKLQGLVDGAELASRRLWK